MMEWLLVVLAAVAAVVAVEVVLVVWMWIDIKRFERKWRDYL